MDDKNSSYAKRSKKYRDKSNFGVTETNLYNVGDLAQEKQDARAYPHHTLPEEAYIYEDTDGMAPPDHSRYTQQSFLPKKPRIQEETEGNTNEFRRSASSVPKEGAYARRIRPADTTVQRRPLQADEQDSYRRPQRRTYRELPYQEETQRQNRSAQATNAKADDVVEEYNPGDLMEHDEFGRPRKKQKSYSNRVKEKSRRKEAIGWVVSIIAAVLVAFVIRYFVFEIILVDGESMYPTLYTNERVAVEKVTRYGGMPNRGDIIIVEYPNMNGTYVKRAIGLPGETVEVKDSTVYIDGQPLYEPYINPEPYADMDAVIVPEDHVFVMGDNRAHSLDSRTDYIGPIPHDAMLGHGLFVIWPFDNIHKLEKATY